MKNRVTIRDVAAASNVSVATVSYVLNGKKKVSEETKQKILTVIDELGFVPDLNARGLTVKDTKLLGVVVPQTEPGSKLMFHNIFYSELLGSIEYAARQRGYHVIISATDVTEDYLQLIQERNLAGVIIIGTYQNQFFSELKTLDVPVVLIDSYCKYDYFHKLRIDDENCSNLATEFVIQQGHKKIALVTGHLQEDGVMQKRYRGFLKAIEQNGLEFQKENLYEATVDYESGVNAAKWFVDNKADITAVVATADVLAIGLMKGFYEQGVQVPEDISIIGFDDLDISKYTTPGLTTVKQPISAKGERAVEILIENIENPQMEKVEEAAKVLRQAKADVACRCDRNTLEEERYHTSLLETQENERQRISRELHDSTVQNLTAMVHMAELCSKLVDMDPIRCKLELNKMIKNLREIIDETRKMIYNLRPMSFDDIGLDITIERTLDKLEATGTKKIHFVVEGTPYQLKPIIGITLLRIIQEACSNAICHANPTLIHVLLRYEQGGITVIVEDDGTGFDVHILDERPRDDNSGFGMSMMKERVYLLSGSIQIDSKIGVGTKIIVKVPISNKEEF